DFGLKRDGGDSALGEFSFQRPQGWVRGQDLVEHHLFFDKAERERAACFQDAREKFKTLLDGAFRTLVLDRKHRGRLDCNLQGAGELQPQSLHLFTIEHREPRTYPFKELRPLRISMRGIRDSGDVRKSLFTP